MAISTRYMNISKIRNVMNTSFKSQFTYCPLTWMCHIRYQQLESKYTTRKLFAYEVF